jgi:hypothetical protein
MAGDLIAQEKSGTPRAPPLWRQSRNMAQKSSKCGALLTGKIIPQQQSRRFRNVGNTERARAVDYAKQTTEDIMYIGLGGILLLILILWLLGVI